MFLNYFNNDFVDLQYGKAQKIVNMTMKGSEISGFNAVYGGGIYVGRGATLTLIDGIIKNNTATYGGAVYVADGGKFIMDGGTISNNTTEKYGCIFVEVGGTIELNGGVVIEPIHAVPWSKCCATVIDKFGVCWWISI